METVLQFLGNHIFLVCAILLGIFVLAFLIAFKGFTFQTKSGNIIRIGGITKNNKKNSTENNKMSPEDKKEELKNFLLINNLVNTWKSKLYTKIEKTRNGLVGDCIRHADGLINKNMNDIKRDYLGLANKYNRLSSVESSYQTMVFNLLLDRATEDVKTFLYEIIRQDHFNSKTEKELDQISESCITKIDGTLDENMNFNIDLKEELKKMCSKSIKDMASDIIYVSAKKYEILKEYKLQFIEESQEEMRTELKSKFGFLLSDCDLETLIEYDE